MAKTKKTEAAEGLLIAVEPIRLDGEDIAPGQSFVAGEAEAAALVAMGAARVAVPAKDGESQ